MSPMTVFLGQFIGLGCLLMCVALIARPKSSIEALQKLIDDPALTLVTGIVTLAAGVALVVGHNDWSGGAVSIAVTVVGWITLVKGFALVAAPAGVIGRFWRWMHYPQLFRLVMTAGAVFGAWLSWASFQV